MDNIGVRFLLGDIALLKDAEKRKSAPTCRNALKGAPNSPSVNPKAWYQAALIAFRQGGYVAASTTCGGA